ncbi:H/ACA ribonucleoprotein complex subunit 1-like [Mustela nigripes]|uniref:H/ACA ribonucleoprotein complex subunit 1-like n=1 Tax=Mustela nigripes TaxID=77151 RepID=UPI0028156C34|nr:H/ACA ribonucleoprotein complex subunit 1-like [Mustela nigripes]
MKALAKEGRMQPVRAQAELSPPLFPKTLTLKITSHFRGRGGFNKGQDLGPLEHVVLLGEFLHPCEDDTVCSCTTNEKKMSYFNAPVDLQNKEQLGKVEEICGQLRDFCFSVKLSENIKASSFKKKLQKFYTDPNKLIPLQGVLSQPPGEKGTPTGGSRGGQGEGREEDDRGERGCRSGGFQGGRGGGGFRGRGHEV